MPVAELRYRSEAIQKNTATNLILPDPSIPGPYHVMFLLHGLSDDYSIWLRRTSIERYCDGLPLIVVMPDGGRGFYTDAYVGFAYESAIAIELPQIIRQYFRVHEKWAVTGLSMGGYGALRLAFRFPELFVSANSHSGATHFGHYNEPKEGAIAEEFARILGPNPKGGPNDLYSLADRLPVATRPKVRVDCGTEDFLIDANRDFHNHLVALDYPHVYEEFPGVHDWAYWDVHVQEALAFHRANLGF